MKGCSKLIYFIFVLFLLSVFFINADCYADSQTTLNDIDVNRPDVPAPAVTVKKEQPKTPLTEKEKEEVAELAAMEAYFKKTKYALTYYTFFVKSDIDMRIHNVSNNTLLMPDNIQSGISGNFNWILDVNKGNWGFFFNTLNQIFIQSQSFGRLNATTDINAQVNHYCAYYRCKGIPVWDFYTGIRGYRFNSNLVLNLPPFRGVNVPSSQSWNDVILGSRATFPLSKNILLTIGGDVGGFCSFQQSFQYNGTVTWNFAKNLSLMGGYENMKFLYIQNVPVVGQIRNLSTMNGPIFGISYNF